MKRAFSLWLTTLFLVVFVGASAESIKLPSGLKYIEEEAFFGDTSLEVVEIPEGVEYVGPRAFAESTVKEVYFPVSLETIEEDAFPSGSTGYGQEGTAGADYFENTEGLTFIQYSDQYLTSPIFDESGAFIKSLGMDQDGAPMIDIYFPLLSWDKKSTQLEINDPSEEYHSYVTDLDDTQGQPSTDSGQLCGWIRTSAPAQGTSERKEFMAKTSMMKTDASGYTVIECSSQPVKLSVTVSSFISQPVITNLVFPGDMEGNSYINSSPWIIAKNVDPTAKIWVLSENGFGSTGYSNDWVVRELGLDENVYSAFRIWNNDKSVYRIGEISGMMSASFSQKLIVDWSAKTFTLEEESNPFVLTFVDEHNNMISNGSINDYDPSNGNLRVSWVCDGADHFNVRAILVNEEPSGSSQDAVATLMDDQNYSDTYIEFTREQLSNAPYLKVAVQAVDSDGNKSNYPWIGYRIVHNESSDVIERLIQIALAEENVGEDEEGKTKYGEWRNDPKGNWCAYFIAWCADQAAAGEYLSISAANANSKSFGISAENSVYFDKSYEEWNYNDTSFKSFLTECRLLNRSDYLPQKGELIYFLGGTSGNSPFGHVGLVYQDSDGQTVEYIDGNGRPGNKVTKRTVSLTSEKICGYGDGFASIRNNSQAVKPSLTLRKSETHISGRNDESEILEVWYRSNATKVTLQMKDASGSGIPIRPDWMTLPTDGSPIETDISQGGLYYRIPAGTPAGMYTMELKATSSTRGETVVTYPFSVRTTEKNVNLTQDQALSDKFRELQQALPDDKYWNVAGETYDVAVSTGFGETVLVTLSDQACPGGHHSMEHSPKDDSMFFTCNHEGTSDDRAQCAGWVRIIGRIIGGKAFNPRDYGISDPNEADHLEAGDIIRSDGKYHSILITGIKDDGKIVYTDCNASGGCKIRWGAEMTVADARSMISNEGYVCKFSDYSKTSSTNIDVVHIAAPSSWLSGRFAYLEGVMPTGRGWWYDPAGTVKGLKEHKSGHKAEEEVDATFTEVKLTGGKADFTTVIASSPHIYTGYEETCGQYFDPSKYESGMKTYKDHIENGSPGHLSAQCMGFTDMLGYYLTGNNRPYNTWEKTTISNDTEKLRAIKALKPGDIICINIGGWELGHKMMITNVDSTGITYVHCNGDNHCSIVWDSKYTWDQLKKFSCSAWIYINIYPGDPE